MPKKYVKRARKGLRRSKRVAGRVTRYRRKNISKPSLIVAKFPGKNPFPRRYLTKVSYSDVIALQGGGVNRSVDQVFRMNSLFDTDLTGTGHQPRYFDQIMTMYNFYRVLGCKIKVKFMSQASSTALSAHNTFVSVIPRNQSASMTGAYMLDINEIPYSKTSFGNQYKGSISVSKYHKIHQIAGVSPSVVKNDDAYRAQELANPSTETYWHVVCGALDTGELNWYGRVMVTIDYYVSFEDPRTPTSS